MERIPAVVYVNAHGEANSAVYMSPRAEEILGYTPKEWLQDPELWLKMLHPDDRGRVVSERSRIREDSEPLKIEYRLVARDGRVVWVRDESVPVADNNGCPQCWHGVLFDITVHKQSEEALKKSEERHRLIAWATGKAIREIDLLTGKLEWVGTTEALFGYPAHKNDSADWWMERIHPEDRERVLFSFEAAQRGGRATWSDEYRFRRADGTYVTVADCSYLVRDSDGRAVRMIGSMADVTEKRRRESALRESEKLFRLTFEAAAVGMAHAAPDGRWLRVNNKMCETLGYDRKEFMGMTFQDLTPPGETDASLDRLHRLLTGKLGSYTVEKRYVRKDGCRVWTNLAISLVRTSSGEPDYFVCVVEDITERKLRELIPNPLTSREMKVLHGMVAGKTNGQIAKDNLSSHGTVKRDARRVLAKLKVRTRAEAVARAVEIGFVPPVPSEVSRAY